MDFYYIIGLYKFFAKADIIHFFITNLLTNLSMANGYISVIFLTFKLHNHTMVRYIAFLNGINPPGQKLTTMEELKEYFEEIDGVRNVSTYMLSGNVLFEADEIDETDRRRQIEKKLRDKLGYEVTVIIRMYNDIKNVIRNNPFDDIKQDDARKLYVTLLSDVPAYSVRGSLGVYSNDAEDARLVQREVYILSSNYGKTCFPNSLIEKKLGVAATTRNWTMLHKILELYPS